MIDLPVKMTTSELEPLVTIVVPSYNHGPYVQECIAAIVAQTYRNIELIVIDDGSTDESIAKIEEMAAICRERFHRFEFRSRPNKGLCETLNEAIDWGRGTYFAVTDSDDVLLPNKTSVLVAQIEGKSEIAGVFGGWEVIDSWGKHLRTIRPGPTTYTFGNILARNKLITSSCMLVRLDMVRQVGGYLNGLYIEDWHMWLKLTEHGSQLKVIPDPLVRYRQHETNISKNVLKMYESRMAIVGLFSHFPEARLAMAKIRLEASVEFSRRSKRTSLGYIIEALKFYPSIVFRHIFWSALARMLTPIPVLDILKKWQAKGSN